MKNVQIQAQELVARLLEESVQAVGLGDYVNYRFADEERGEALLVGIPMARWIFLVCDSEEGLSSAASRLAGRSLEAGPGRIQQGLIKLGFTHLVALYDSGFAGLEAIKLAASPDAATVSAAQEAAGVSGFDVIPLTGGEALKSLENYLTRYCLDGQDRLSRSRLQ